MTGEFNHAKTPDPRSSILRPCADPQRHSTLPPPKPRAPSTPSATAVPRPSHHRSRHSVSVPSPRRRPPGLSQTDNAGWRGMRCGIDRHTPRARLCPLSYDRKTRSYHHLPPNSPKRRSTSPFCVWCVLLCSVHHLARCDSPKYASPKA